MSTPPENEQGGTLPDAAPMLNKSHPQNATNAAAGKPIGTPATPTIAEIIAAKKKAAAKAALGKDSRIIRTSENSLSGRDYFAEAREKFTIADAWQLLGIDGEPKASCKSPFREDRSPSFSIFNDGTAWTDHATGDGGDVVEFIRHGIGGDHRDVREWLGDRLGTGTPAAVPSKRPATAPQAHKPISWPSELVEGTQATWEAFAEHRGLTLAAVHAMVHAEILRFTELPDGSKCYVITDRSRRAAEIRRMDGKSFGDSKAYQLSGVDKSWLPGVDLLKTASPETAVLITEGATDLLSAFDLCERYRPHHGGTQSWQPVALLGAVCKRLHPEAVDLIRGRHVRLVPDGDDAGDKMADHWTKLLHGIGCTVDVMKLPRGTDLTDQLATVSPDDVFSKPAATPDARPESFEFFQADQLGGTSEAMDFVEGLLTEGGASVIYGPSNCGKSFWIVDLGVSVASGTPFRDELEVEQGAVIYIALEGAHGARNRIAALKQVGRLKPGTPFFLIFAPVSLLETGHADMLAETIDRISEETGLPVRLVILDTMARAMAGGDENSGVDMTAAVKSIDAIRAATGAHVAIVHHCGKNEALGARGHSSLRAAVDTEIEVSRRDGETISTVRVTKQRDLQVGEAMPFSLEVVTLGTDRRGKPITSCIVHHEDEMMANKPGKTGRPATATPAEILKLLPMPGTTAWQKKAKDELGVSSTAFYALLKRIRADGSAAESETEGWRLPKVTFGSSRPICP